MIDEEVSVVAEVRVEGETKQASLTARGRNTIGDVQEFLPQTNGRVVIEHIDDATLLCNKQPIGAIVCMDELDRIREDGKVGKCRLPTVLRFCKGGEDNKHGQQADSWRVHQYFLKNSGQLLPPETKASTKVKEIWMSKQDIFSRG
jgi:hypothetical protein